MASWKKPSYPPPPKNKIIIETRIVKTGEKPMKVKTLNGKIQEIYNGGKRVWEKYDPTAPIQQQETKPIEETTQIPKEEIQKPLDDLVSLPPSGQNTDMENGIQLIPKEETKDSGLDIPKSEEIPNIDMVTPESSEKQAITDIPKMESNIQKMELPKVETPVTELPKVETPVTEPPKVESIVPNVGAAIPKVESTIPNIGPTTPKVEPTIPKVELPKLEFPNIGTLKGVSDIEIQKETPKEVPDMPIPGVQSKMMERLGKIMEEKTSPKIDIDNQRTGIEPSEVDTLKDIPKADIPKEVPKVEAPKVIKEEKKPIKEAKRFMTEEQIQQAEERKFEEWLKRHKFQENVEKMTDLAAENQKEIENISTKIVDVKEDIGGVKGDIGGVKDDIGGVKEEIGGVKGEIVDVRGGIKDLEQRLGERIGSIKKPVSESLGELCTGVDCIKGDIKKSQEEQVASESKMNQRFEQLSERLKALEEPTFVCDNCGDDSIRPLNSFCPNCGSPIHEWNGEDGQPVKGWVPFWKRGGNINR